MSIDCGLGYPQLKEEYAGVRRRRACSAANRGEVWRAARMTTVSRLTSGPHQRPDHQTSHWHV